MENSIPERVESYSFCIDVLEMAQNRCQVGPEIHFSVPVNTIIASKTLTPLKSAPSHAISSKLVMAKVSIPIR